MASISTMCDSLIFVRDSCHQLSAVSATKPCLKPEPETSSAESERSSRGPIGFELD